ncbi:MAG TPA: hypothetical protein VGK10_16255 [Prolixibacteraceae bacterium]|jgi:hypothetical protein
MKNCIYLFIACSAFLLNACKDGQDGMDGLDGQNATVYYSEWFSPASWDGTSGDWYFDASAPDLTQDIVEGGVVLAYVWLADDVYQGAAVRPLPAYAIGANWSFLIMDYGSIEFTSDMSSRPLTSENKFRFIAIPGTIPALKSGSLKSVQELKNMSYQEVCKLLNIPE